MLVASAFRCSLSQSNLAFVAMAGDTPGSVSLKKLHDILQIAIGWMNSHAHQFAVGRQFFGIPDSGFSDNTKSETRVQLDQALIREKDAMVYEYDFGDGWMHKVVLEKIVEGARSEVVPSCIGGARACPPEDRGGIPGYEEFLDAIRDLSYPEHEEMREWAGGPFDPERFDVAEINQRLAPRRRRARPGGRAGGRSSAAFALPSALKRCFDPLYLSWYNSAWLVVPLAYRAKNRCIGFLRRKRTT